MRYFLTSCLVHILILLVCLLSLDSIDIPGGSGGSQSSAIASSTLAYSLEGSNEGNTHQGQAQDSAQPTVEKTMAKIEPNKDIASSVHAPKEVIKIADLSKKEEPIKNKSVEKQEHKDLNLKQKKDRLKQEKAALNKGAEKNKDAEKKSPKTGEKTDGKTDGKASGKNTNNGQANGQGNGSGKGKGNGDGDGFGEGKTKGKGKGDGKAAKEAEEAALAQAVYDIQTKIMQFWFPPEEFAARQDIVIIVELKLDQSGNILAYKLVDAKETVEYRAVAASVLRVLNDPRVTPLPIGNNKKLSNIILKFCPRDLL